MDNKNQHVNQLTVYNIITAYTTHTYTHTSPQSLQACMHSLPYSPYIPHYIHIAAVLAGCFTIWYVQSQTLQLLYVIMTLPLMT